MATLLLAAAGGAIGGSIGGGVLGLSSVAIGKAVGATVGAVIDQKLLGAGSAPVEIGRRDRFRITGSEEGAPVSRVWGQMRVSGQVIWASRFLESVSGSGGGKGTSAPSTREYSYSVSLAVALCEGEITRIGRVWADGQVVDTSTLEMRVYAGAEDQLPDPLIAASVPEGEAPAYRGLAYVVIENLALAPYGNRIPQLSFEVLRRVPAPEGDPIEGIKAVALTPGAGEYVLATEPVSFAVDKGETTFANVNNDQGRPDIDLALDNLVAEVPNCGATSLVVSWFGSDLRCGQCTLEPKVEQTALDATEMPWRVSGLGRGAASVVGQVDGRPGFGGTPADASVLQAIGRLKAAGQAVMFYPFILMDIRPGNGLTDPYTGAPEQPPVPWRGRITGSLAPGVAGSPDRTSAAGDEVAAFIGAAQPGDFAVQGDTVVYSGPAEWSYRRFILHYAHICAAAGGIDSFCIGSELRGLTQLRDGPSGFPMVAALKALAADVRAILGPGVEIGYAADWSEYFGYHPADGSGDLWYHLDPLWSDPEIDFVGIDNYMPLSDWRDGEDHADAAAGSIHDLDYLRSNIAGGEGYDWYYASPQARGAQVRSAITDGAYGMPWVYRYKDLVNWWKRSHFDRPGGVLDTTPTAWEPESKPIWFTEMGCPAIDKGTNQPNVFLDPQSSENAVPHFSSSGQDRVIQRRYLQAMQSYYADPDNNPVSYVYEGPMVDMSRAFVWAWDARPWPQFPQLLDIWSDGMNHARGHWISGRTHLVDLAEVVREICARAGLETVDVETLVGDVQGFQVRDTETARASLQPLLLAYGFDAYEREGRLLFRNRSARAARVLDPARFAVTPQAPEQYELGRIPEIEVPGRVRVGFVHPFKDYQNVTAEAQLPGSLELYSTGSEMPLALSHVEGERVAARWLSETQVARDRITLALPPSDSDLGPGDVVELPLGNGAQRFRIDRVEETSLRQVEAVRVEASVYRPQPDVPELIIGRARPGQGQPYVEFLDLPLLTGEEDPYAPWISATRVPWNGPLAVFSAPQDHAYAQVAEITRNATVGTTLTALPAAEPGRWAEQSVEVRLSSGALESRGALDVLNGANAAALRHGGSGDWEVFQFRDAELIGPETYRLSGLIRGQSGTDAVVPELLSSGADFVLLDGAAVQVPLGLSALGLERHLRVGPMTRGYDDPAYAHLTAVPTGVGLRPYAPAHLRAERQGNGDIAVGWIRRTRIGGDSWVTAEAPLGESVESYRVRMLIGGSVVRNLRVGSASATYSAAAQAADGAAGVMEFSVAQVSEIYGPGAEARIIFNG